MTEKEALIYAKMPEHKALVQRTRAFIRESLKRVSRPYVACSFGKDSSAMLHLVLQDRPDIDVVFVRRIETDLVDNFKEIIEKWRNKYNINLKVISYKGWLEENPDGVGLKTAMDTLRSYDSFFMGIRAEESKARRITLRKKGQFYEVKDGLTRICPMAWWKLRDVAAYTYSNGLPILGRYLFNGMETRTTSNIPSKYPRETLAEIRQRDIDSFNKLLELLPNARNYI